MVDKWWGGEPASDRRRGAAVGTAAVVPITQQGCSSCCAAAAVLLRNRSRHCSISAASRRQRQLHGYALTRAEDTALLSGKKPGTARIRRGHDVGRRCCLSTGPPAGDDLASKLFVGLRIEHRMGLSQRWSVGEIIHLGPPILVGTPGTPGTASAEMRLLDESHWYARKAEKALATQVYPGNAAAPPSSLVGRLDALYSPPVSPAGGVRMARPPYFATMAAASTSTARCVLCGQEKERVAYSKTQWGKRNKVQIKCSVCLGNAASSAAPNRNKIRVIGQKPNGDELALWYPTTNSGSD